MPGNPQLPQIIHNNLAVLYFVFMFTLPLVLSSRPIKTFLTDLSNKI